MCEFFVLDRVVSVCVAGAVGDSGGNCASIRRGLRVLCILL